MKLLGQPTQSFQRVSPKARAILYPLR